MSDAIRKYRRANPLPQAKRPLKRNELDESPTEPFPVADAFNGWLHPNGEFYPCVSWEHDYFAFRLADKFGYRTPESGSRVLEENGWLKLKSGEWIIALLQQCTQRQLDTLFDWCQSKGRALESLELL